MGPQASDLDDMLGRHGEEIWGSHSITRGRTSGARYDMHYVLELGILLKGRVRRYSPSWETELGPGQVWLCGVWEQHGREVLEPPSERVAYFILPTALMSVGLDMDGGLSWMTPFTVPPQHRPQAHGAMCEELLALGHRAMTQVSDRHDPQRRVRAMLMVMEVLLTLCKGWEPPDAKERPPLSDHTLMSRVIEMVFSNTGLVTVQAAAQACGMNRNTFSTWFMLSTGLSFPKFALRYRISSAAHQLRGTDDPVKVIARDWGFAHVSHMHRCFLEHYGVSPAVYRKTGS